MTIKVRDVALFHPTILDALVIQRGKALDQPPQDFTQSEAFPIGINLDDRGSSAQPWNAEQFDLDGHNRLRLVRMLERLRPNEREGEPPAELIPL